MISFAISVGICRDIPQRCRLPERKDLKEIGSEGLDAYLSYLGAFDGFVDIYF